MKQNQELLPPELAYELTALQVRDTRNSITLLNELEMKNLALS
jgi:hypothetical protein